MKYILITGAAGFIGSNLIKYFLKHTNYQIIAIDNLSLGQEKYLPKNNGRFIFKKIDISSQKDLKILEICLKDKEIYSLWHLAANSDIPAGVKDSYLDFKNTFLGTYEIIKLLKNKNLKQIHFASSSAVYGNHDSKKINENSGPLLPISNYGAFKLASESFLSSFVEETNTKLYIYRFPNVVGTPSTHGILFDFISRLNYDSTFLKVKGNGNQRKQYLYVDDLITAMIIGSSSLNEHRNILNIGPSDNGITVKEIAELTIQEYGKKSEIIYGKTIAGWKGDIPKFNYDISKLKSLDWVPIYKSSYDAIKVALKEIIYQLS